MKMMNGLLTTDLAFLNQGVRELCLILSPVALFMASYSTAGTRCLTNIESPSTSTETKTLDS